MKNPVNRKTFLDPRSDNVVEKIATFVDELRPLEGERVADAEEAVAAMAVHDENEEDRRLRKELIRTVADREPPPLLANIDPEELRVALFTAVWERGQQTGVFGDDLFSGDSQTLFHSIGQRFGLEDSQVPEALFADTPAERRLVFPKGGRGENAQDAVRAINLERLRQRLRRAVRLTLELPATAEGGASYVPLLWGAKRLGLMYDATNDGRTVVLDVSGPYALFGKTTMYGNRLYEFARLVLQHAGKGWRLRVQLLVKEGTLSTNLRDLQLDASMRSLFLDGDDAVQRTVRSGDEEAFQKYFSKKSTTWRLDYEGSLLVLESEQRRLVMIPDFVARRGDSPAEVFIEIVGFWKKEYLEKKIEKVRHFGGRRLMLIVNAKLAIEREGPGALGTDLVRVFFYNGREELKRVVEEVLEELEAGGDLQ